MIQEKTRLVECLQRKKELLRGRKINQYYPDTGPLRRELYVPHIKFFKAGSKYLVRAMISANRIGKSEGVGGYETALHLTGLYPNWWNGKRFDKPIKAWAAGDTNQTTRDICQFKLLGLPGEMGTGLIPKDCILDHKMKAGGVPDAIESVIIKHYTGGKSWLVFKSFDQKRKAFQGTEQDLIWLDEEPPQDIFVECLTRTMTTFGHLILTFTPLSGMSDVVSSFMPGGKIPNDDEFDNKFIVQAGWNDAPHLTEEQKKRIIADYPTYQREARTKGIPMLGAGAIYPIAEEDILVKPFPIPEWWPKLYGFDVGWNKTAAVWATHDTENDVVYLIDEYYRGLAEPVVHASAIRARGEWIPGAADPASRASSQRDGKRLLDEYIDLGLDLVLADNAVDAGLLAVWKRMSTSRLKVFASLQCWLSEFRVYQRDQNGDVVKKNDHLMDDTRYLINRLDIAIPPPIESSMEEEMREGLTSSGKNKVTGY